MLFSLVDKPMVCVAVPVSYTHLDVYKRQHQALWNKRLRTTGGRFFPKDGHLDFNPKLYEEHGLETFRKIVRHELCHYHLYFQGKGCKHGDRDFKDLLARVDGLRYAPKMRNQAENYFLYQCQSCGHTYRRKRRVNTQKFGCGLCLSLIHI